MLFPEDLPATGGLSLASQGTLGSAGAGGVFLAGEAGASVAGGTLTRELLGQETTAEDLAYDAAIGAGTAAVFRGVGTILSTYLKGGDTAKVVTETVAEVVEETKAAKQNFTPTVTPLSSVLTDDNGALGAVVARSEELLKARPDLAQGSRAVPSKLDVLAVGDALDDAFLQSFPAGAVERGQRVWSLNFGVRPNNGSIALSVSGNGRRLNDAQYALVQSAMNRLGYGVERLSIGQRTADVGSRTPLHAEGPGRAWVERLGLRLGGQYTTAFHCTGCTQESIERGFTLLNLTEFYTERVLRLPR